MGTIANKLSRILQTKKDIQKALVRNGKYVPDKLPFRYYPDLIDNMNINGLVGMYYGKGLTNDELSKDPTWYDTSGNGNDLKFKNFAWKLDSGAGLYTQDFNSNDWYKIADRIDSSSTGSSIFVSSIKNTFIQIIKYLSSGKVIPSMNVKISGMTDGVVLDYRTSKTILLSITSDGIYTLPSYTMDQTDQYYGFKFNKVQESCNIIIEQIPDYEGAICFNGVDDYAICDNFPILTSEKGYTVMALRRWLTPDSKTTNEVLVSNLINSNIWSTYGAFNFELKYNSGNTKYGAIVNFGLANNINISNDVYSYQTSAEYNKSLISKGSVNGGSNLLLGSGTIGNYYANVAIYALCIIDHDTSDAEREIVINKWKQYYPELLS